MELLVFLAFLIFNIIAYLIPKKLNKIEIYSTSIFAYAFGLTVDLILDLHYGLYGYFKEGFQWSGLLAMLLYFPCINILFLNFTRLNALRRLKYYIYWHGPFSPWALKDLPFLRTFFITTGGSSGIPLRYT